MSTFVVTRDYAGRPCHALCAEPPRLTKEARREVVVALTLSPIGERLTFRELIACYEADGFRGALTARCVVERLV